jgi:recombinational DNA repair protein (RecF pathway)
MEALLERYIVRCIRSFGIGPNTTSHVMCMSTDDRDKAIAVAKNMENNYKGKGRIEFIEVLDNVEQKILHTWERKEPIANQIKAIFGLL